MKHACNKCGLRHNNPSATSVVTALVVGAAFMCVDMFAACALDGWLSVALWVAVWLYGFSLVASVFGLALLATNAMKGELP